MFSTYGTDDQIWPIFTAKITYFICANLCRIVNIYSTANSINNPMKLPQKCDIFYIWTSNVIWTILIAEK